MQQQPKHQANYQDLLKTIAIIGIPFISEGAEVKPKFNNAINRLTSFSRLLKAERFLWLLLYPYRLLRI